MKNFLLILMLCGCWLHSYADDTIYTCPNVVICKNNQCTNNFKYGTMWEFNAYYPRYPNQTGLAYLNYPYQFANGIYIFYKATIASSQGVCSYKGLKMPLTLRSTIHLKSYGTDRWTSGTGGDCYQTGDSSYCTMKAAN